MIEKAYGKINLSIDVIGKTTDGYHQLDMIMLPIDLYDVVGMEVSETMEYQCNIEMPYDEHNIVYKAVELMRKNFDFKENFRIILTKNIPMQAGLAGGSTDAAAVMRLINQLLDLKQTREQLAALGKQIGADVPFCVYSCPARVKGIGEQVTPFKLEKGYDLLLIKPQDGISTRTCFELTDKENLVHPDMDALQQAFISHQPFSHLLGNSLQRAAVKMLPEIEEILSDCKQAGYDNSLMTGSGSTCFVMVEEGTNLDDFARKMGNKYNFVYKTHLLVM